jgi:quercetin dioxygenase-like cupin family protein
MSEEGFSLEETYVHLGLGSVAVPLPEFTWDERQLEEYTRRFESDGAEGRLVCVTPQSETWDFWERHPGGDELVVLLSGRVEVIQDLPQGPRTVVLLPGQAMINPKGTWHTSDVHEPGLALFVTPGAGTEHRGRAGI